MAVGKKLMSKKKPTFPINGMLDAYLKNYNRNTKISLYYDDLLRFQGSVTVYDKNDEEADFEKRFSFYYDYAGSSQLIGSQKDSAVEEIFERITQDVFNASLAKW